MNYKEMVQNIKKDWFENHIAEFTKLSDRVSTLTWSKPGSSFYYTRYVFDGCKLYVSGDIGEAVFCLTENASLEKIKGYSIGYLHRKLSAYSEAKYDFDTDTAIARLKAEIEEVTEYKNEYEESNDEEKIEEIDNHISVLNELISDSHSCCSTRNWEHEVEQKYDVLSEYDCDVCEWIFNAGDVIPLRIQGYLVGLQMAWEQLNIKEPLEVEE